MPEPIVVISAHAGSMNMSRAKKDQPAADNELQGLEEATAGWDPYLSDLLNGVQPQRPEERRRAPRDSTPARRRTILVSNMDDPQTGS